MLRKVFIKANGDATPKEFAFEGTTFGELKEVVGSAVNWDGSTATVRSTRTALISDLSVVPLEAEVHIFVIQDKMKGGAMSRTELLGTVRTYTSTNNSAKAFFGNYPSKDSVTLTALLNQWESQYSTNTESVDQSEIVGVIDSVIEVVIEQMEQLEDVRSKLANLRTSVATPVVYGGATQAELDADYAQMQGALSR